MVVQTVSRGQNSLLLVAVANIDSQGGKALVLLPWAQEQHSLHLPAVADREERGERPSYFYRWPEGNTVCTSKQLRT